MGNYDYQHETQNINKGKHEKREIKHQITKTGEIKSQKTLHENNPYYPQNYIWLRLAVFALGVVEGQYS